MPKSANLLSINLLKFYFLHLHTILLRLITYSARHTFATTTTLSKGVPIETVSKMLGHTNIKTTQIYARITNEKISKDMQLLSSKLDDMEKVTLEKQAL